MSRATACRRNLPIPHKQFYPYRANCRCLKRRLDFTCISRVAFNSELEVIMKTRMTHMKKFWMSLLLMSVFSAHILNAQTNRTYFPYVVNDGKVTTDLLLTNATSRDAVVSLTGYQQGGTAVNPSQSPVSVPANAQVKVSGGS